VSDPPKVKPTAGNLPAAIKRGGSAINHIHLFGYEPRCEKNGLEVRTFCESGNQWGEGRSIGAALANKGVFEKRCLTSIHRDKQRRILNRGPRGHQSTKETVKNGFALDWVCVGAGILVGLGRPRFPTGELGKKT